MKIVSTIFGQRSAPAEAVDSLSDLMSALMLIFLLTSIALLAKSQQSQKALEEAEEALRNQSAAHAALQSQLNIYERLAAEQETTRVQLAALLSERIHADDLARWSAEFNEATLSFRFNDPETLFQAGSASITHRFDRILSEFGPALMGALDTDEAHHQVAFLRIEGHTSSEWSSTSTRMPPRIAHMRNMALSQDRAFAVVQHLSDMETIGSAWSGWASGKIQALGLGPNRLLRDELGEELTERSRRVEVWVVPRNKNDFHNLELNFYANNDGQPLFPLEHPPETP